MSKNLHERLDRIEDKMDNKFERIFCELKHLRGKLYFGAGAISVVVSVIVAMAKGWV